MHSSIEPPLTTICMMVTAPLDLMLPLTLLHMKTTCLQSTMASQCHGHMLRADLGTSIQHGAVCRVLLSIHQNVKLPTLLRCRRCHSPDCIVAHHNYLQVAEAAVVPAASHVITLFLLAKGRQEHVQLLQVSFAA